MIPSGKWRGFYWYAYSPEDQVPPEVDSERAFPIEAQLLLQGNALTGTMRDLRPAYEHLAAEQFDLIKSQLDWYERNEWLNYLKANPGAIFRLELPEKSLLEGGVEGAQVHFIKTYRGESVTIHRHSQGEDSSIRECAPVLYKGRYQPDAMRLLGTWEAADANGRQQGRFWLDFVSADVSE